MSLEQEIQRFKMELLRKMPFYGDIVMRLEFVEDKRVQTAATNGKTIWYNSKFLSSLKPDERNFIIMHEVFHVLLRHGARNADGKRDHDIWNTACDIVINDMLNRLQNDMRRAGIAFAKPSVGIFAHVNPGESAENLYAKIKLDNEKKNKFTKKIKIRWNYTGGGYNSTSTSEVDIPSDIRVFDETLDEMNINDQMIQEIIRQSAQKNRGTMGSVYVPAQIYQLAESKKLDWKKLLKDFLSEEISDESSYTTPERKYLHMDMILPGHSLSEEGLEDIWAFVDSSGSIGHDEMEQFLTQLYRISKEFKCVINICYWDTQVTDVYKKIVKEEDILKCVPHHSGGTDINCVYDWIQQNKVKPDIMLILTDGYFGPLRTPAFSRKLGKKTILILSSEIMINEDMKKIGKIAKL